MRSLLAVEWLKLKRYRTFWVLIGLFAVLLPLWNWQIASGVMKMGGGGEGGMNLMGSAYAFPQVWGNIGFWGSVFILFLSILVIIITTNEYAYRTNRQNVIDGFKRLEFFHAKVMLVMALSVAVTLYFFLLGMLFGGYYSHGATDAFSEISSVAYFFVLCLNYLGMGLFISVWIRRSGLAIGLFLLYSMIIENILKGVINHTADMPYGNLLPLQASDELLPFPLMEAAKAMAKQVEIITKETYMIASFCWCAVYYFAARTLLAKNDW